MVLTIVLASSGGLKRQHAGLCITKDCSGLTLLAIEWGESFYQRAQSR